MFNQDFYPTPIDVAEQMLSRIDLRGKTVLEPSAGKGDLVKAIKGHGADMVIGCEIHPDLRTIAQKHCRIIKGDFLTVEPSEVSHIHAIIGNPPFSKGAEHILHAYNIAPDGCDIIMLCNYSTYANKYSRLREQLSTIIESYGTIVNLGECFSTAERTTDVKVGLVHIRKGAASDDVEFDGFFMGEELEQDGAAGIMPYNAIRDIVNRYVGACNIFKQQQQLGIQMNTLISGYMSTKIGFNLTSDNAPIQYNEFKKEMQKAGWDWVLEKMNLQKFATAGLKSDINKFVEQQVQVPFTMRNIYRMIDIVIGTAGQRMDRAIMEVFTHLTMHYSENRYNVEGWKTNSHYLVNEKFIMPGGCNKNWGGGISFDWGNKNAEKIDDLQKALCYLTGTHYDSMITLNDRACQRYLLKINGKYLKTKSAYHDFYSVDKFESEVKAMEAAKQYIDRGDKVDVVPPMQWGEWADWGFFEMKCYKKQTVHFRFKDKQVWALFNQNVARIMGYPLPEGMKSK